MQRICAKDHGSPKCPSVVPFEILHSEGPFEVASFEHFGLERPFNMVAMIVFTPKCLSEGDISRLECTVHFFGYLSASSGYLKCTLYFWNFQCEHTTRTIYTTKRHRLVH